LSDWLSYVVSGLQVVAGVVLTATGNPGAGVPLIISGLGSAAATALAPEPTGVDGWKSSQTYGFDRAQNVANEGSPLFVVLGKMRVAPTYVSAYTAWEDDKETLYALLSCGSGGRWGLEDIDDLELNETPIEHFKKVSFDTRLGTSTQTAMKGFEKVGIPYGQNHELGTSSAATFTWVAKRPIDELRVGIAFYGGLYSIKSSGDPGKLEKCEQEFEVLYKLSTDSDSADWRRYPAPTVSGDGWHKESSGGWGVKEKEPGTVRRVMVLDFSTLHSSGIPDAVTVRIRTTRSSTVKYRRKATIVRVEELVDDARTYAGHALIGLKAVANAQLAGGLPRVTALVSGIKAEDPNDSNSVSWTRSAPLLLRELLLNEDDGLGDWLSASDFDNDSLDDAVDYCAANAASEGDHKEARHELDLVVDVKSPAGDWVSHIMKTFRCAQLVEVGGKLHFAIDKAGTSDRTFDGRAARLSTNRPILRTGSPTAPGPLALQEVQLPIASDVNILVVKFVDRDDRYRRARTPEVKDTAALAAGAPEVRTEVFLPGITRETEAIRQARFLLNLARLRPIGWRIGVSRGDLDLLPMQLVTLMADHPSRLASPGKVCQVQGIVYEWNQGSLDLVEYDAGVYSDTTDTLPAKAKSLTRSEALARAATIPRGATNVSISELI